MTGPFDPNIMPVTARYRWDDIAERWKLFASRYVAAGAGGRKYEQMRQTFDNYEVMLTAISHFFGND